MHWTLVTTRSRNQTIKQNEIAGPPLFAPRLLYFSPHCCNIFLVFFFFLFFCCSRVFVGFVLLLLLCTRPLKVQFCSHQVLPAPFSSSVGVAAYNTPLPAGFRLPMLLWHVFASVASVHLARRRSAPLHSAAVAARRRSHPSRTFPTPQKQQKQRQQHRKLQLALYIFYF